MKKKKNYPIVGGESKAGRKAPKCPLPRRVAVFPDIELKYEDCRVWTQKTFGYRMPPGIGWEDLVQETLREILEDERAQSELDQTKRLPDITLALRLIHRRAFLPDALGSALKQQGAHKALIALLENPEAQQTLRTLSETPSVCTDVPTLALLAPDIRECISGDKSRFLSLTILACGPEQPAVLAVLRQYLLTPVLRRILRWWRAFELSKRRKPKPLVPFEAAFKQTCRGRWGDAWRKYYHLTPDMPIVEATPGDQQGGGSAGNTQCYERGIWDEALQALGPRDRLVICLSYPCQDYLTTELGQLLGLDKLRIQPQLSSDAFILPNKGQVLGGSLRFSFFSASLDKSAIYRVLRLTGIYIPLSYLRASLSQHEVAQVIAGQIKLSFFRDDLTSSEIGQMLGVQGIRVVRLRAISRIRKFFPKLR